ncbi:NUDIX domain-containing protein [Acidocella sp. KAb 2-4]|uniref:NUDIX hydrolase n=1 Tax=Acidocella sp. KAb 2-4 TaxID=2885158 RepID=UPI001D07BEF6|nr:NUDIX domain-containing protein [Acidocella sp. KAb 2-4]MCB5943240.1 NUDIX domain-containing protein [Acidocella sp. KAb 2-4]
MSDAAAPAATLILFDESAPGPARHLMLQRTETMRFAAGALVFPGGRVEDDDHAIAASAALARNAPAEAEDGAARVAAIRETLEETGIATAIRPAPSPAQIASWRAALKTGAAFSALLAESGRALDLGLLTPFSRWRPGHAVKRRFDTRFYVARREGEAEAAHDEDEAVHLLWRGAAEFLGGGYPLVFPTLRNLERLAAHPSHAATLAHLAAIPARLIIPEIRDIGGEPHLCIPEDAGYPVTQARMADLRPL